MIKTETLISKLHNKIAAPWTSFVREFDVLEIISN